MKKHGKTGQATDDNIIWRMRFACWTTEATNTNTEYLIFIVFPWQQWLRERASMLRLYAHCLSGVVFYSTMNQICRAGGLINEIANKQRNELGLYGTSRYLREMRSENHRVIQIKREIISTLNASHLFHSSIITAVCFKESVTKEIGSFHS